MTNPERSVSEIVEEFRESMLKCDHVGGFNRCILKGKEDAEYALADTASDWLTQTLQAERQASERAVREERERIKTEVMIVYEQWRDEVEDKRFDTENIGMFALGYRLRCCFEIEKSTTLEITQPNNK